MRKYTVLLLTFFCFYSLSAQKQLSYLDENKKKIHFETIDTLSYILFKTGVADAQKRTTIKNNRRTIPLKGRSMFLNINSEDDIMQLRSDSNVEAVYRVIRSQDGDIHVLTDDILVKVNSGERIESVFSQLNIPYISESPIDGLEDVFLVRVPSSDKTLDIVNRLMSSNLVVYAEPDFIRFTDAPAANATVDNYSPQQWAIKNTFTGFDVNALLAWRISKGKDIKVAVIDEGVDLNHPDLKANLLPGYDTTNWGSPGQNGDAAPDDFHGTACAGIIAAVENNIGMTGIAPQCKMIPVRIATGDTIDGKRKWKSTTSSTANGIIKAYRDGDADVLSCSFGILPTGGVSKTVKEAIVSATTKGRTGRGAIVVFSTGNEYTGSVNPYCLLDKVISVGAMDLNGSRCDFSNYGNGLKVVAPGSSIYTTDISGITGSSSGDYCYFGGTSAACPYVAGIAALLLSVKPDALASSVASWIYTSCRKLPAYQYSVRDNNGTWNNETGYGLVDAYEAVIASKPFTMIVPDLLCECETHTFSLSGSTDRCDSIVWNLFLGGEIISGDGTNSIEVRISNAPGYSLPVAASIYYDDRVVTLEEWPHAGIPETHDIEGANEATEWEYMYVVANMDGATSYTWELLQGNCGIWPYDNKADIMPYDTNKVTILVTGHNRCGSWSEWLNFTPSYRRPSWDSRQVGTKSVAVYNLSYKQVYSDKKLIAPFDIKTANLSPGFYIIEYQLEDGTIIREKVYVP